MREKSREPPHESWGTATFREQQGELGKQKHDGIREEDGESWINLEVLGIDLFSSIILRYFTKN